MANSFPSVRINKVCLQPQALRDSPAPWDCGRLHETSHPPIAIGDRIFSIDTSGEVVVLAAGDSFRVIARNPMGQGSRATLAVAGKTLLIRTEGKLFAIRGE